MAHRRPSQTLTRIAIFSLAIARVAGNLSELTSKAESGDAAAQYELATAYDSGNGVGRDVTQAARWCEKAVARGFGEAFTNLGYLYDLGKGVAQDRARAVELYVKGAESGSLNAMLNLGLSYWKGDGVAADRAEAFKWLDLARF